MGDLGHFGCKISEILSWRILNSPNIILSSGIINAQLYSSIKSAGIMRIQKAKKRVFMLASQYSEFW